MPRQPALPPKFNIALLIANVTILILTVANLWADYEYMLGIFTKDFVTGTLFGLNLAGVGLSMYNVLAPFCTDRKKQEGGVRLGWEKS